MSSRSQSSISTINDISKRINKLFRNPHINFFIIMNIILLITCYTFISSPIQNVISDIISNPVVILFVIIIIIVIGYFDINIAVLSLILFFVALYGMQGIQGNAHTNIDTNIDTNIYTTFTRDDINIENFTSSQSQSPSTTMNTNAKNSKSSKTAQHNKNNTNIKSRFQDTKKDVLMPAKLSTINNNINLQYNQDKEKSRDTTVKNIKNVIFKTLNNFKNSNDNDYKNALLENKQKMFNKEKQNNKSKSSNSISREKFDDVSQAHNKTHNNMDIDEDLDNNDDENNTPHNKNSSRSNFQTIKHRTFDPSLEEDTNLLITKEILQDMSNRIEYNYENTNYLKKYIKHRVEEIVNINKLLEDD